jgi:hypothetical protein
VYKAVVKMGTCYAVATTSVSDTALTLGSLAVPTVATSNDAALVVIAKTGVDFNAVENGDLGSFYFAKIGDKVLVDDGPNVWILGHTGGLLGTGAGIDRAALRAKLGEVKVAHLSPLDFFPVSAGKVANFAPGNRTGVGAVFES